MHKINHLDTSNTLVSINDNAKRIRIDFSKYNKNEKRR